VVLASQGERLPLLQPDNLQPLGGDDRVGLVVRVLEAGGCAAGQGGGGLAAREIDECHLDPLLAHGGDAQPEGVQVGLHPAAVHVVVVEVGAHLYYYYH